MYEKVLITAQLVACDAIDHIRDRQPVYADNVLILQFGDETAFVKTLHYINSSSFYHIFMEM